MEEPTSTSSSRRGLLGRGLVMALGAVGLGAASRPENAGAATPATARSTSTLRLYARQLHLQAPSRVPGQVPEKGDRHTGYAQLLNRPNGRVVGHFTAAHLALHSPFAHAGSLEIHTFHLADGTIHGLGTPARGAEGHFVVLGGTGRYTGVSGSYVARQNARELGGNGTAEFNLTLAR
jgi:hypothetical protein